MIIKEHYVYIGYDLSFLKKIFDSYEKEIQKNKTYSIDDLGFIMNWSNEDFLAYGVLIGKIGEQYEDNFNIVLKEKEIKELKLKIKSSFNMILNELVKKYDTNSFFDIKEKLPEISLHIITMYC